MTIISKPQNAAFDEGWERVFGKRQYVTVDPGSKDMTATTCYEVDHAGNIRVLDVQLSSAKTYRED